MTRYDVLWLAGLVIGGVGIVAAICVHRLGGVPRHLRRRLGLGIAAYLLHGTIGIAIIIYLSTVLPGTPAAAVGGGIALLAWIGLGVRILLRLLPGEFWPIGRPKPRWMQRFGIIDVACLFALVGGGAAMAGLISSASLLK